MLAEWERSPRSGACTVAAGCAILVAVDAIPLVFIATLAVLLGWALAVAISRGRTLERLQDATGAQSADDVERLVRDALEQAGTARWQAGQ